MAMIVVRATGQKLLKVVVFFSTGTIVVVFKQVRTLLGLGTG